MEVFLVYSDVKQAPSGLPGGTSIVVSPPDAISKAQVFNLLRSSEQYQIETVSERSVSVPANSKVRLL